MNERACSAADFAAAFDVVETDSQQQQQKQFWLEEEEWQGLFGCARGRKRETDEERKKT